MFTDLKGSTSIAEEMGDNAIRLLIEHHNDIVFPIIESGKGKLVKTMGDGTMSYFDNAQDAVQAGMKIQKKVDEFNKSDQINIPMGMRIGIHTGPGLVEKKDIFGDVVNVASRFETLASPGEIYLSEETYNLLADNTACFYIKTESLKGKSKPFKIFEAVWDESKIDLYKSRPAITVSESKKPSDTHSMDSTRQVYTYTETSREVAAKKAAAGNCLVIQRGEEEEEIRPIDKNGLTIGRSSDCDLVLDERYISRKHARITNRDGVFWIEDLKSGMGVVVNGKRISKTRIQDGDEIKFGPLRITLVNPPQEAQRQTEDTMVIPAAESDNTLILSPQQMLKLAILGKNGELSEHDIPPEGLILGRSPTSDVRLDDPMVSRRHMRLSIEDSKVFIEDLGSNNGTQVNNKKIKPEQTVEIKEKELVKIADFSMMVVSFTQTVDKSLFTKPASLSSKVKNFLGGAKK